MKPCAAVLFLCSACVLLSLVQAQAQAADSPLKTLRPGHPRLLLLDEDLPRLRALIKQHELAGQYYQSLRQQAEGLLDDATVEYKIVGPRLLAQSRRCMDRVYTLALIYRLDGDERFARRAVQELSAAARFPDWNPSHFLDTAEMSHAFAIGYDWLYGFLSAEDRATIRNALIEKGLRPGERCYQGKERYGWWVRATHNWNQVCNGGIGIGALALADEEPQLAEYLLSQALAAIRRPMQRFAPDGGWDEGPGYWNYATRYNVYFLAALETALGTDFGLSDIPGFAEAGNFRIYFCGPVGQTFNYADAGSGAGRAAQMFWFARRFDRPEYAWHQRDAGGRPDAHDLMWFDPRGQGPKASGLPLDALFRGVDVAFLRSAWEDPSAIFVGFKGGNNRANHSHLDLGSFVLDALGQRWALDLGGDNYNLPGYFGGNRWTYYRLRTEGHNTLVLAGENQDPRAQAPIVAFLSTRNRAFAVADLSQAYAAQAKRVRRGMALLNRRYVLIQDEIEAEEPVEVVWAMHTKAQIAPAGAAATLSLGDARVLARIVEPTGAEFQVLSANPPRPQAQQPDVRKLAVSLEADGGTTRLAVLLSPHAADAAAPTYRPQLTPLDEWVAEGKMD
ncbi:MAG: heparinase II/III family protein [Armatimonadota bacterium]